MLSWSCADALESNLRVSEFCEYFARIALFFNYQIYYQLKN